MIKERRYIKIIAIIAFLVMLIFPSNALAYSNKDLPFSFDLPENVNATDGKFKDGVLSMLTSDFGSISITIVDIYPTIVDENDDKAKQKYPRNEIWQGCGLFEKSWDNPVNAQKYLTDAVNGADEVFKTEFNAIEANEIPMYKIEFSKEIKDGEKKGGYIYTFMIEGRIYTINFSNASDISVTKAYADAFESSISTNAIFNKKIFFEDNDIEIENKDTDATDVAKHPKWLPLIIVLFAVVATVLLVVLMLKLKSRNRRR